ncbi:MAG: hypothetical protein Q4D05_00290 [Acinetobacter sp.]|nr:hypothetical protein [Acinetobacter sp.]
MNMSIWGKIPILITFASAAAFFTQYLYYAGYVSAFHFDIKMFDIAAYYLLVEAFTYFSSLLIILIAVYFLFFLSQFFYKEAMSRKRSKLRNFKSYLLKKGFTEKRLDIASKFTLVFLKGFIGMCFVAGMLITALSFHDNGKDEANKFKASIQKQEKGLKIVRLLNDEQRYYLSEVCFKGNCLIVDSKNNARIVESKIIQHITVQ